MTRDKSSSTETKHRDSTRTITYSPLGLRTMIGDPGQRTGSVYCGGGRNESGITLHLN